MSSTLLHICLETDGAPDAEGHEVGSRWICECGLNYVFHEGFNPRGGLTNAWFVAPPLPKPRSAVGKLLFGPRKG
ncbi:hypothetical protein Q9S36_25120 [Microbacterium sp. ARD31]|jgi:hypothetical protein|uniref:hypothetical protein n=1 Tax=Microbacterium sp. ARD31 TaxID=2962576 RepID=UPI002881AD52|nr:hypothetical protein [Microbacterium sp. ARD31]MDT0183474.1 hypothetical protein [Microbacterium sp. ARD31]